MIYLKEIRLNKLPEETSYLTDLPVVKNLVRSGGKALVRVYLLLRKDVACRLHILLH